MSVSSNLGVHLHRICRDRRSLGSQAKPAGVLVGHTEGVTYVSPKGDGRYVVSNGKDQTMRLWDLRKMRSHSEWEEMPRRHYGRNQIWDYRSVRHPWRQRANLLTLVTKQEWGISYPTI